MSIIEDVVKRAGVEEVKVEDLRLGDKFVMLEDDEICYEGAFDRIEGDTVYRQGGDWPLTVYNHQRWYLVERAPVQEPTGWGAIVEVNGVKHSRVPDGMKDPAVWIRQAGSWHSWDGLTSLGPVKVLFEGISE